MHASDRSSPETFGTTWECVAAVVVVVDEVVVVVAGGGLVVVVVGGVFVFGGELFFVRAAICASTTPSWVVNEVISSSVCLIAWVCSTTNCALA